MGQRNNAIVRTVNKRENKRHDAQKTPTKPLQKSQESVFDRLHNSKTRKSKEREKVIEKKKVREARNCSAKVTHTRSRANKSQHKYFSIENPGFEQKHQKVKNRRPTPVAPHEKPTPLQDSKSSYLSMSAKDRANVYNELPKFASENPSCPSQFSDKVESQAFTEIDDDLDTNLNSILLSIKKQNENLRTRIKSKTSQKANLTATLDPENSARVLGVPLDEFQTPDVSKFKTKTANSHMLSPERQKKLSQTEQKDYLPGSCLDSEEPDLEREEVSDTKIGYFQSQKRLEDISEKSSGPGTGVTCGDCTLLKSCVTLLAEKLRSAQKEIENLKEQKVKDEQKLKIEIQQMKKDQKKLKSKNRSLNKSLLQAIETMKMSVFNFELNRDEPETVINSLQVENRHLRLLLRIQNRFDCRPEVEEILKSEELLVRNKENFLRSRSLQMRNEAMFNFLKKEEELYHRKGKKSQDAKTLVRGAIRRNRRKDKRKRSESFDATLFVPPTRLDDSDEESSDEFEGYDFEGLDSAGSNSRSSFNKNVNTSVLNDVMEDKVKEDQGENTPQTAKNDYSFGFGSGYSMKLKTKDNDSPGFKKGYKMSTG